MEALSDKWNMTDKAVLYSALDQVWNMELQVHYLVMTKIDCEMIEFHGWSLFHIYTVTVLNITLKIADLIKNFNYTRMR